MAISYLGNTPLNSLYLGNTPIYNVARTPFEQGGLIMWLDADDPTTVITSSQEVYGLRVSEWRDKSGNNNHAIAPYTYVSGDPNTTLYGPQVTSSFAPMNNRTVLNFDFGAQGAAAGASNGMQYANPIFFRGSGSGERAITIFMAFYTPDYFFGSPSADLSPAFFSEGSGSGDSFVGIEYKPFNYGYLSTDSALWLTDGQSNSFELITTSGSIATPFSDFTPYILTIMSDDSYAAGTSSVSSSMYINTTQGTTKIDNSITYPGNTSMRLLGFNPADIPFRKNALAGCIGEILVFDHYLEEKERQKVYTYLSDKWGI